MQPGIPVALLFRASLDTLFDTLAVAHFPDAPFSYGPCGGQSGA